MTIRSAAVALALCCAGCASVVDGPTQAISVVTTPVTGAACIVSNARGQWNVVTPGSVAIKKSESVLTIRCSKQGWQDGVFYASGHITSAGMTGMLLFGVVDSAVDASTGAALTYPDSYTIELKPAPAAPDTPKTPSTDQTK
jgi:hypothetical protein